MARVSKHPEERRAEILDAAAKLFAERGFTGTTMNDIAEALGVAHGTVYYYFASKEDLLLAIFAERLDQTLEELQPLLVSGPDATPLERIGWLSAALEVSGEQARDDPLLADSGSIRTSSAGARRSSSPGRRRCGVWPRRCWGRRKGRSPGAASRDGGRRGGDLQDRPGLHPRAGEDQGQPQQQETPLRAPEPVPGPASFL